MLHTENEHMSSSESLISTSKRTVICGVCSKVFENVKITLTIIMKMESKGHHTDHMTIENDFCPLCDRVILSLISSFKSKLTTVVKICSYARIVITVALRKIL